MKAFSLQTGIQEFDNFAEFAADSKLCPQDLIVTNEYIYRPVIAELNLGCQTVFQEKYGSGEPTDTMVDSILNDLKDKKYERILAVGGGTVIDIAKMISVAENGMNVDSLFENKDGLCKVHDLIAVPTTCGTGSEVTNVAVVNRTKLGTKMGLAAPQLYPEYAVLISGMLKTLPYKVFATSSIDAMVHAVESFLSPNACNFSEIFSKNALEIIIRSWEKALRDGQVKEEWKTYSANFLRASNYAGIAFGYAGCAAVHASSYPIGGKYHVPHGQSNQLMFTAVMKKYKSLAPVGKINDLENILSHLLECRPEDALQELDVLMNKILRCLPLHEVGVKEEDLPVFAKDVIKTQQRLLKNNYTALNENDLLDIYKTAF